MKDLNNIMNSFDDEPKFTVELSKRQDGTINVYVYFENCSSEPVSVIVKSPEDVGNAVTECVKKVIDCI